MKILKALATTIRTRRFHNKAQKSFETFEKTRSKKNTQALDGELKGIIWKNTQSKGLNSFDKQHHLSNYAEVKKLNFWQHFKANLEFLKSVS